MPVPQSEIYIFAPASTAGAQAGASYGLIGAIVGAAIDAGVDAHRTAAAETAAKPVRDSLVDYNFDASLSDDTKISLSPIPWMHVDNVRVTKEVNDIDGSITSSTEGGVLLVYVDYRLENAADALTITYRAAYYGKNDALKALQKGHARHAADPENSLFHDTLIYTGKLAGSTGDRDANVALWAANNGALVRSSVKDGLAKLSDMLASDLQRTDTDYAQTATTVHVGATEAKIVSSDANGDVVRLKNGALEYVPTAMVTF